MDERSGWHFESCSLLTATKVQLPAVVHDVRAEGSRSPLRVISPRPGGAIYSLGPLVIQKSVFSGNFANHYGGAIYTSNALSIVGSLITSRELDTMVAVSMYKETFRHS